MPIIQLNTDNHIDGTDALEERVNAIMDEVRGPLQGRNMWERLSELNEGIIARYLRGEYPQTVAAILTKMRPDITAKVLPLLPRAMMLDVVERISKVEVDKQKWPLKSVRMTMEVLK